MLVRKDRLVLKVSADGWRVGVVALFAGEPGVWYRIGQSVRIEGQRFIVRRSRMLKGIRLDPANAGPRTGDAGEQCSLKLGAGSYYGVWSKGQLVWVERLRPESIRQVKCEQILQLAGFDHFTIMMRNNLAGVSANAYDACTTDSEIRTDQTIRDSAFALFGKRVGASEKFTPAAAVITSETEPSDLLLTLAASGDHWSAPALHEGPAQQAVATT